MRSSDYLIKLSIGLIGVKWSITEGVTGYGCCRKEFILNYKTQIWRQPQILNLICMYHRNRQERFILLLPDTARLG